MTKLTLKDRKLLYELDLNSRQTINELARKIGLSKTAVAYKLKKLQEEGVIRHFHTVFDVGTFGYNSFRLYLKFENTAPDKEAEIINFLKNKEEVTWLVSIEGDYDVGALILVKSISEMNALWKELTLQYGSFLAERFLAIMTHVTYYSRAFILDETRNNTYETNFITEPVEQKLDEKEIRLLKAIAITPRKPLIEIAQEAKMTPKTALQKIRELEKRKIILGYRTAFDYKKLGYEYVKLMFRWNKVDKEIEKRWNDYSKQNPFIVYKDDVLGGEDVEIELNVKDHQHLRTIIADIKQTFGSHIRDYKTLWFYKEHKYLFMPAKM